MCDGYEVTLILGPISQFKNAILVYINGQIKGEWLNTDCEYRRRFFRTMTKSLISPKKKAALKKLPKKIRLKLEDMARYTCHYPYWTSFHALKRHLVEHNENIELIREQEKL